jgi:SAM-dependent methyltransferase
VLQPQTDQGERLYVARDFFGVKKVMFGGEVNTRMLLHGDTMHGLEAQNPRRLGQPLAYYHTTGPLGDVMEMMKDRPEQRVGVVGLGAGAVAAYSLPNRRITFFEIDPQVESIAREYFTFLTRCGSQCDVVLADGRLALENSPDSRFDLLVLDAFNSDSIPAHLVSREALAMYRLRLKPDGAILFHVSNRYLKVEDLVASLVTDAGLPALMRNDTDQSVFGKSESLYYIAALNSESISPLAEKWRWEPVMRPDGFVTWTDDYSNLLGVLRW